MRNLQEIAIESAIEVLANKGNISKADVMIELMNDTCSNLSAQFNKLIASTPQVLKAM
jgi:hypothetical protein